MKIGGEINSSLFQISSNTIEIISPSKIHNDDEEHSELLQNGGSARNADDNEGSSISIDEQNKVEKKTKANGAFTYFKNIKKKVTNSFTMKDSL